MPENSEKQISRVIDGFGVVSDGFCHRLIDRFVEAGKIVNVCGNKSSPCCPLLDSAGPQRSIFRNQLIDVEPIRKTERGMYLRGTLAKGAASVFQTPSKSQPRRELSQTSWRREREGDFGTDLNFLRNR
jgi:hypothetical protein